jgi:hypothetical protein
MITGYVDAYRAFGEEKYLNKAITNANFLLKNVISKENELTRNYKNGKATIPAFLDDYAFTITALKFLIPSLSIPIIPYPISKEGIINSL